jgi:HK97 family phage major capsid protein
MAEPGARAKTVLFGELSKYLVREVSGAVVRRLVERYADYNQTGYILFARFDGDLIDAGTHPVKYIAQPAP